LGKDQVLRIESDPKVQAFRFAKAKAELEGPREPIEDFMRGLKRGAYDRSPASR